MYKHAHKTETLQVLLAVLHAFHATHTGTPRLVPDFRTAPVAALRVVADLGVALHAEPLRQRTVGLLLLGQQHLQLETLDRAHLERLDPFPSRIF